jgi:hypothetical protein
MDSNTHSTQRPSGPLDRLASLEAAVDDLAAQDTGGLSDAARAERVLRLRRLVDRLEGQWLSQLAAVDACGAAGADHGQRVASTAAWLRNRLRMGAGAAAGSVRTARALFGGPLRPPPAPSPRVSSPQPMLRCWPTAATTSPTTCA